MWPACWVLVCTMGALTASACTIFELNDSGFAANAVHLLHMEPMFGGGNNGTLFVDATKFAYKCSEGGGWDFLYTEFFHCVYCLSSGCRLISAAMTMYAGAILTLEGCKIRY